jgi:Tetracyclin repressor-like, C-terminal domain
MIKQVVEAYVTVKMDRADISVALYKIAPDVGGTDLVKRVGQRLRNAIEMMLQTAPDVELPADKFAIDMMLSAMSGRNAFRPRSWSITSDVPKAARAPCAALPVLYESCSGSALFIRSSGSTNRQSTRPGSY